VNQVARRDEGGVRWSVNFGRIDNHNGYALGQRFSALYFRVALRKCILEFWIIQGELRGLAENFRSIGAINRGHTRNKNDTVCRQNISGLKDVSGTAFHDILQIGRIDFTP